MGQEQEECLMDRVWGEGKMVLTLNDRKSIMIRRLVGQKVVRQTKYEGLKYEG